MDKTHATSTPQNVTPSINAHCSVACRLEQKKLILSEAAQEVT